MKRICVYCGSNKGQNPQFAKAAKELGTLMAQQGIGLVYGGGNVGLMGVIADAALAAGGEVIGVIPQFLYDKEVGHTGITELKVVKSMHERKLMMAELSDAFITLPGGFGTFEEMFESVTWTHLNLQEKPCGFLNIDGFYDGVLTLLGSAIKEGFILGPSRNLLLSTKTPEEMLMQLKTWKRAS